MSFPNWLEKKSTNLDFPLENLPYGIFLDSSKRSRPGVALGDHVIDLCALQTHGYFTGPILSKEPCFSEITLNSFMSLGKSAWSEARSTLQRLFDSSEGAIRDHPSLQKEILIPMESAETQLPARIGDFTDFYASKEHASNIGSIVRDPKNPLAPNWVHLPVAYHGRASSVVISGIDIPRPYGQVKDPQNDAPLFQLSAKVDYELEMGLFIGPGNPLGKPINIENAMDHAFGVVLLNDWSARDVQQWEMLPLGPFNSKNLGTTISPWIIPMEALEPFACDPPIQDPPVLSYLTSKMDHKTYDINLEVHVQSQDTTEPELMSKSNLKHMYWTFPQMIAHHTITGCNLQPGDLLGTGTISSSTPQGQGCLLELSINDPSRGFLKNGDKVTLKGWCEKNDGVRIGFGECEGRILENH